MPNVLGQDFTATGPDEKWGVDISYVWTAEGWLYLAIVLDLFSRRIVGWSLSDRMKRGLAMDALQRAIALRQPPRGLIHHSDRGSQYCSADYRRLVRDHGFVASMSGRGNCYDNAFECRCFEHSHRDGGDRVQDHQSRVDLAHRIYLTRPGQQSDWPIYRRVL